MLALIVVSGLRGAIAVFGSCFWFQLKEPFLALGMESDLSYRSLSCLWEWRLVAVKGAFAVFESGFWLQLKVPMLSLGLGSAFSYMSLLLSLGVESGFS